MRERSVRWRPFWLGLPHFPLEHFFSVDQTGLWRQHLVYSKRNGQELRGIITQRFASNSVFLSLMLSTEIGVFFSPSGPAIQMRIALADFHRSLPLYAGITLCLGILFAIAALTANFTAWGIFTGVSVENSHIVYRSTMGLYGGQLPARLIIIALYLFFIWNMLFWFVIMPLPWAIISVVLGSFLIVHIMSTYSALGRMIIHTSSMGDHRILSKEELDTMNPYQLHQFLLRQTKASRHNPVPIADQYQVHDIETGLNVNDNADHEKARKD